jgi:hypothetical protein
MSREQATLGALSPQVDDLDGLRKLNKGWSKSFMSRPFAPYLKIAVPSPSTWVTYKERLSLSIHPNCLNYEEMSSSGT